MSLKSLIVAPPNVYPRAPTTFCTCCPEPLVAKTTAPKSSLASETFSQLPVEPAVRQFQQPNAEDPSLYPSRTVENGPRDVGLKSLSVAISLSRVSWENHPLGQVRSTDDQPPTRPVRDAQVGGPGCGPARAVSPVLDPPKTTSKPPQSVSGSGRPGQGRHRSQGDRNRPALRRFGARACQALRSARFGLGLCGLGIAMEDNRIEVQPVRPDDGSMVHPHVSEERRVLQRLEHRSPQVSS